MRKVRIRLKYAGQCACCGAAIAAGETADYNAAKREVTHEGGIKGACFSVLNEKANGPAKSAEALAERHGGAWMEHPVFGRADWRYEVGENNTSLGYWDWVLSQIEMESVTTEGNAP